MSFKKTVTFTANVSDYTDGTVSARVQAENNILGQLVTWLLAQNTSISQIEKVEIGDSHWSGYPMYAVNSSVPSDVSYCVNGYELLSDIYMLGKDADNFLLGLCVDGHVLTLAPSCSFEFQDALNTYSSQPISIVMEQLRRLQSAKENNRKGFGALNLYTFSTTDDELSLTLNFWKGTDSMVISVPGGLSRLFFSFDAVDASWGWLGMTQETSYSPSMNICNYSFSEKIQADNTTQTQTRSSDNAGSVSWCLSLGYPTNAYPYYWGSMSSYNMACYVNLSSYSPVAVRMHRMCVSSNALGAESSQGALEIMMETDTSRVICCNTLWNFPRVTTEQLYLRKMYIPNRTTASPVKLGYTPGNLYADAIYEVNNKYYLCLKDGWCSYFIEVAEQG